MTFSLKAEGVIVSIVLLLSVPFAAISLRNDLETENHLTAKRLAHAFIPLLAKAHHAKDDLALQEAVMALAQAPGVSMASVIDADEKIIAHNHLSQIGKPFEGLRASDDAHNFPLKDGATHWGSLVFYLSESSLHHLWMQWSLILAAAFIFLSIVYSIRLSIEAYRLSRLRQALADQTALGQEKHERNQNLEQRLQQAQRQAKAGFQTLLKKFPEPVLLLDGQQRVTAFNLEAGQLLGLDKEESWLNASWQDVPWLQDQGAALEHSLQTPNEDVVIEDALHEGTFRTEAPWTWVSPKPRPALRAYR